MGKVGFSRHRGTIRKACRGSTFVPPAGDGISVAASTAEMNPLVGDWVPRDVDWLIGQLAKINSTNLPDETVVRHALGIYSRLIDLRIREHGSHDLRGSIKKGLRVKPRAAKRGLANELARLERAARSGSKGRWIRAWAAFSPRCRQLVWHPALPPVIKCEFDESGRLISFERAAPQEEMVGIDGVLAGPRAANLLAAIVAARCNLAVTDRDDRRGNKRNDAADALAAAIRSAVFDLTGRVGVTRDPVEDRSSGPLVELGAAFDARFRTRICWRLIATK
jgi:hypothetical protein